MAQTTQPDPNMDTGLIAGSGFDFTGTRIAADTLGATEYTLVTVAVDETGSVELFADQLLEMLRMILKACQLDPRSENILLRVIAFNTRHKNGVREIHGFKPLAELKPDDYQPLRPAGGTPLFDATFSAIGATNTYGEQLHDRDYGVNAVFFIITDGENNASVTTPAMIKAEIDKAIQGEKIESVVSILIGINVHAYRQLLEDFQRDAGLTSFIDAGDATPEKLAKIGEFISQSISSTSQAIGTGGPSQTIPTVI
jgi:uncharacterized protein YegL